jgi:RimJ/RimL family protein N-acetyltransferase
MFEFAIIDADGSFAGGCGINHINRIDRFANLGYWVRTSRAGRGVVPAAVQQLVSWTFANTDLNRVEIVAAIDNLRSQRVAEKVGAHRDAIVRKRMMVRGAPSDAVLYSIVRPDQDAAQHSIPGVAPSRIERTRCFARRETRTPANPAAGVLRR